jgi:hypothetical protein
LRYTLIFLAIISIVIIFRILFMRPLVLVSAIEGKLVNRSGDGVANIRLVRRWNWAWNNREGSDEAFTDKDGHFRFSTITSYSFGAQFIPHEPNILQKIIVQSDKSEIEFWAAIKSNYLEDGELRGTPLKVLCGLDSLPGEEKDRLFNSQCILTD